MGGMRIEHIDDGRSARGHSPLTERRTLWQAVHAAPCRFAEPGAWREDHSRLAAVNRPTRDRAVNVFLLVQNCPLHREVATQHSADEEANEEALCVISSFRHKQNRLVHAFTRQLIRGKSVPWGFLYTQIAASMVLSDGCFAAWPGKRGSIHSG